MLLDPKQVAERVLGLAIMVIFFYLIYMKIKGEKVKEALSNLKLFGNKNGK